MLKTNLSFAVLISMLAVLPAASLAADDATPTIAEQMNALEAMCEASSTARSARHVETPLYERLGGYDRILELTTEIVRLHGVNDSIKRTLDHVDPANLAKLVADFVAAGTGGEVKYEGRDLPSSHAHLKLTDADFLSAGGDVVTAMQSMKYGQAEIDEIVCILVSLKDQVVFE